jgi:flagellar motor protein MotB
MDWERFDTDIVENLKGSIAGVNTGGHPGFIPIGELFRRNGSEHRSQWHIPWSDLMMTMFILFAVMYVYASSRQPAVTPKVKDTAPGISAVYDLSKTTVEKNHLENFASVELVRDKAVRILLTSDLLFDTGKADLKGGAVEVLRKIAAILRKTPYLVNLVGHTDDIPIHTSQFPSNWELSTARACAVARFLTEEMKIPPERFCTSGYADYHPLRPNVSPENRAANRRVEIIITKETI